jgi:hypothetical protein
MRALVVAVALTVSTGPAAADKDRGGGGDRWNVTGPNWYETECGHIGFSPSHGLPNQSWRKPCSVPVRVCEFKQLTVNYIADPDVPCEKMVSPEAAGPLQRTYLKTWD